MQSNQIILSLQKRQASAVVQPQQNYLTQKVALITNQKDLYALPQQSKQKCMRCTNDNRNNKNKH